jgi:hypothetical protein
MVVEIFKKTDQNGAVGSPAVRLGRRTLCNLSPSVIYDTA